VTLEWVEKVIEKERPDGILAGFGGQTALNCLLELDKHKVLDKYQIEVLGTEPIDLIISEDREKFAMLMKEIGIPMAPGKYVSSAEEALSLVGEYGLPLFLRTPFALGGLGSGIVHSVEELKKKVEQALAFSDQVMVEKSLLGFKELEYEIMRDGRGNLVSICNMENIHPLGIHTGDSVVVAPSQTLSDNEYQNCRDLSFRVAQALNVLGECNVQLALDPEKGDIFVIEMNARLSRSSALASKASGYPIAYIAAKLCLGISLIELKNPVTEKTSALFEPAFDYVIVKIPKWDLKKFIGVSREIGPSMKSVGEVMAISRNFKEALCKGIRCVTEDELGHLNADCHELSDDQLKELLARPTDEHLFHIFEWFRREKSVEQLQELTGINKWFLYQIRDIVLTQKDVESTFDGLEEKGCFEKVSNISKEQWLYWKKNGLSDAQITYALPQVSDKNNFQARVRIERQAKGIIPHNKKIDTTAGEHPCRSNYLYLTYDAKESDLPPIGEKSVLTLGGGAYHIGCSVEFDWSVMKFSDELQLTGYKSILINCNPETVSTDFNRSDRLYFEEMTLERIQDIYHYENPKGVVVCLGGQLPNLLSLSFKEKGLNILGHSSDSIRRAESRHQFSQILDDLGIDQPAWTQSCSIDDVKSFIAKIGFPVLVRPSFVLSGTGMNVAYDEKTLLDYLEKAAVVNEEFPVVLSQFIEESQEIEVDGVSAEGQVIAQIVSEHLETAGVHSGDATIIHPAASLSKDNKDRIQEASRAIARVLKLNGPFNIQFLLKDERLMVIECNARSSRSFPFSSKVSAVNLVRLTAQALLDKALPDHEIQSQANMVGVKAPMFSFTRLEGADPSLSVEMASTGEVGCLARDYLMAQWLSFVSTGFSEPQKGILLSSGTPRDKEKFLEILPLLKKRGIKVYATKGTCVFLKQNGFECHEAAWPGTALESEKDAIQLMDDGDVDLVINIPKNYERKELKNDSEIRSKAVNTGLPLITHSSTAVAFFKALDYYENIKNSEAEWEIRPL
jgi:carbamoyl-phosphate synthase large subunit